MKGRHLILLVLAISIFVFPLMAGCSLQQSGGHTSPSVSSSGGCPPAEGIVIVGTQGCPHCRALKMASQKVFGPQNVCFVEVSPSYGGTAQAKKLFVDFYSIAYPGIPEREMGVPIAAIFHDGKVRAVFVGEMSEDNLRKVVDYIKQHDQPIIAHGSRFYKMDPDTADRLKKLFEDYFSGSQGEDK